jgi:hypothetical protein
MQQKEQRHTFPQHTGCGITSGLEGGLFLDIYFFLLHVVHA